MKNKNLTYDTTFAKTMQEPCPTSIGTNIKYYSQNKLGTKRI